MTEVLANATAPKRPKGRHPKNAAGVDSSQAMKVLKKVGVGPIPAMGSPAQLERQFQAYQLRAMGWTLSQIARALGVSYNCAMADVRLEAKRRAEAAEGDREHLVGMMVDRLDVVITHNYATMRAFMSRAPEAPKKGDAPLTDAERQKAEATPQFVTPDVLKDTSQTIIKATALQADLLGLRKPTTGPEAERPLNMINLAALTGEHIIAILARIASKKDEIEAMRRVGPGQVRRPALGAG